MSMPVIIRLPDALHARPANLLVKLASRFAANVMVAYGSKRANAKNILEVLGLGAAKGVEVALETSGDGAEAARDEIVRLIERNFDQDLVPELGSAAVEGIAIGRIFDLDEALDSTEDTVPRSNRAPPIPLDAMNAALARATADVEALMASLSRTEAQLFEPEIGILRDLAPVLRERIAAGEAPAAAVKAATEESVTDLILDARVRLLDALSRPHALGSDAEALEARLAEIEGDVILVTAELTPSLVASLPRRVVGIIAASAEQEDAHDNVEGSDSAPSSRDGFFTSHAALLARGRGLPLVVVPEHVARGLGEDMVILDTTENPARLWGSPSAKALQDAIARRDARVRDRAAVEERAARSSSRLTIALRVNVGSVDEDIPRGAEGIGLVRTELVFAADASEPDEARQLAVLTRIAAKANGAPVIARLFDAGGDKPLPWLPPPASDPEARGVALLLAYPEVLATQLRAIGAVARNADVRAMVPLVRNARDMEAVRNVAPPGLAIGAMVETREAVDHIDAIAAASDFLSIGTNDLTASVLGESREHGRLAPDAAVIALIQEIVERGHSAGKQVTVCGEYAASEEGSRILIALGVDALSVPAPRYAALKLSLAN